jgi:hypothetical protein
MVMRKTKIAISFLVIAVAILFAGNQDLYAGAGVPNPWGIVSPAPPGTKWTGNLVITGQLADVPGLPGGLSPDAQPLDPCVTGCNDQVVKIQFFVRLENKRQGFATFSGLAKDQNGYYLFYPLADYGSGRIGDMLNKFLNDKVYPNLPGGPYARGVITDLSDDVTNVDTQLCRGLQAETPLYLNANITVVTHR